MCRPHAYIILVFCIIYMCHYILYIYPYDELLEYYSNVQCDKIYLVHGQQNAKINFANELKNLLEKKNKTTQVICVNKGTEGKF